MFASRLAGHTWFVELGRAGTHSDERMNRHGGSRRRPGAGLAERVGRLLQPARHGGAVN